MAVRDVLQSLGLKVRAGIHTGEVELRDDDISGISGITVHIAARIAAAAGAGEVIVSRIVVDLVAGSGLSFAARGEHALKGVAGEWGCLRSRADAGLLGDALVGTDLTKIIRRFSERIPQVDYQLGVHRDHAPFA